MLIGSVAVLAVLTAALICLCSGAFTSFAWLWLLPVSALGVFLVLAAVVFFIILAACAAVKIDRPQDKSDPRYRFLVDLLVEAVKQYD